MDTSKMIRLLMESFEVALIACNASSRTQFGVKRIINLLAQIIPSGFFYSTSYWPLYVSSFNECLCICGIFDIKCLHVPNNPNHFLNLQINLKSDPPDLLLRDGGGYVKLLSWFVNIERIKDGSGAYEVEIKFKSQSSELLKRCRIKFRLVFCGPKFNYANLAVCFDPHPLLLPCHGAHIPPSVYYKRLPLMYTITADDVPPFTLKIDEDTVVVETIA